ncbi:MAG TPA: extracellular solute-binding protein, partial [Bacillota bacterium]|nr:extracellular solute-binding protein [Bacillota bacterium]
MFLLKKISIYGLAIIFIVTFTLSPLGAQTDPKNIPAYEETDIGKEAGINHPGPIIRLNSKQQLVVYDVIAGEGKSINRFVTLSLDGKILSELKVDFTGEGQIFALDPKDNLYVVAQEHIPDQKTGRDQEIRRKLFIYDPKGKKLQTLDLGKTVAKDDNINFLRDMAVDSKGNVYLVITNEGLSMVGKNAKKPKNLRSSGADYYSIVIDPADNLMTHGFNRSTFTNFLEKMKPTSGAQIWKTNSEGGEWINRIFYNSTNKSIYALGRKQIGKYDSSGKFGSVVFDFMDNGLIGEDIRINSLAVDPLANMYLSIYYRKDSKNLIKKYSPIPDSKMDRNQKTLTIAVARSEGNFLEKACTMFQKTHPGWNVNIKQYSGQGSEGYRKTLNTELLAGKGPDIIAVGSLPYLEYCEKKILVDLNELIAKESSSAKTPELDWSKFDLDTMKACEYEGKLYVLPVNVNLEVLYANQTLLDRAGIKIDDLKWTWRDFLDIAVKVTKDTNNDGVIDQFALPKMSDIELFSIMSRSMGDQFLDYGKKTARFDSPEFRELLSVCKSLIDKKVMNPQVDFQKFFLLGQGRGSIAFHYMALNQYSDPVVYRELVFQDKVTILSFPGTGQKDLRFNTSMIFAINRHSPFKNEAWELLKIMCSDEMQNSPEMMSFPINLTARK